MGLGSFIPSLYKKLTSVVSRGRAEADLAAARAAEQVTRNWTPEPAPAPGVSAEAPSPASADGLSGSPDLDAPAVPQTPDMQGIADADEMNELDNLLGDAFAAKTGQSDTDSSQDSAANHDLFAGIAANHTRPVKNFIHELQRETTSREWAEICVPVTDSILDGASMLELDDLVGRLTTFRERLVQVQDGDQVRLDDTERQMLLDSYDSLIEALPEAFALSDDDRRRESIILHALLRQVQDVGLVTMQKLYEVGLTSVEAIAMAHHDDLAATTGIPTALCDRICVTVRNHREMCGAGSDEDAKSRHRARLSTLSARLRQLHADLQRVADGTSLEKREILRERMTTSLEVEVLLAEMGEMEMVERFKKMAVERRIEELDTYLAAGSATVETNEPTTAVGEETA